MVFLIVQEVLSQLQLNTLFLNLILLSLYQPNSGRNASGGWDARMLALSPILYVILKLRKLFIVYIAKKGVIGSIDFVNNYCRAFNFCKVSLPWICK